MRGIFLFLFLITNTAWADGAYLVRAAGCTDCHSVSQDQRFAGGLELKTPFGTFRTPNITPSNETGIGKWTFEDFRRALREGIAPNGQIYYPSFPYRSYTRITDEDSREMWAYLRSVPAIEKKNIGHDIDFPFDQRWLLNFWQDLFFRARTGDARQDLLSAQGSFKPVPQESESWNRGAYLVEGFFHCAECHTPRETLGNLRLSQWMGGSRLELHGLRPPNITPDKNTGRGNWSARDWMQFLSSGINKDGKSPAYEMADVIQNTSAMSDSDRAAMVEYLMSLKPVRRGHDEP